MTFAGCSIPEQYVNPLFEVFDGGEFILSSYRDVEESLAQMRIYLDDPAKYDEAARLLSEALAVVGANAAVERGEIRDEDWKYAYRRHFKTEEIGRRLVTVPAWESVPDGGRTPIVIDPGLAFGTGKHETTRACLEYIDELASPGMSFLDMGCGSGILSIAAAKLGMSPVVGFDVDAEAVSAARENAERNGVDFRIEKFALGRLGYGGEGCASRFGAFDLVAANILGPLLVKFADEIAPCVRGRLVVSGILAEVYPEVLAAFAARGFKEASRKSIGEWTTGLLTREACF